MSTITDELNQALAEYMKAEAEFNIKKKRFAEGVTWLLKTFMEEEGLTYRAVQRFAVKPSGGVYTAQYIHQVLAGTQSPSVGLVEALVRGLDADGRGAGP